MDGQQNSQICDLCLQNDQEQNQKDGSSGFTGNLLLKLPCGHTICEKCIRSLLKLGEPIQCKKCFVSTEVKTGDILLIAQDKGYLHENISGAWRANIATDGMLINVSPCDQSDKKINLQLVKEIVNQLMKTVVDIGQQLDNNVNGMGTPSEVTQIVKLCTTVQNDNNETIELPTKIKSAEEESLIEVTKVFDSLQNSKEVTSAGVTSATANTTQFTKMIPLNFQKKINAHKMIATADSAAITSVGKLCAPEDLEEVDIPPQPEPMYTPQLPTGSQQLVHISHVVDPHNFFVYRASDNKLVHNILREYQDSASEPKPHLASIAEGKIYLAFSKVKGWWLRCRVLSVEKKYNKQATFVVYCFDIGIIEIVSIKKLRLLSPDKWYTPLPLAIHCSLANCDPINGEWTNADTMLFENILDNRLFMVYVELVIHTEEGIKFHCHVTTYEQKISLAHALVFHGRAKMIVPNLKNPIIQTIEKRPQIVTSNYDLIPNSVEDILLTYVVSPDKFFVRKVQHQSDFNQLCKELNKVYSSGSDSKKIFLPEIGLAYVVDTKENREKGKNYRVQCKDVTWARCVVTEMATGGYVIVQLVDLGMLLRVHWTSLRAIQSRFMTLRALATQCHLAGVTTPRNSWRWSQESVAFFKKFQEQVFNMRVEEKRYSGSFGACLFYKSNGRNRCINYELVKYKYAIRFGAFRFNKPTQQLNPKPVIEKQNWEDEENYGPALQTIEEKDLVAKDKGPLRWEVKILNYASPQIIYLMFVHQETKFGEMFEDMQKYYERYTMTKGKNQWQVSEMCCTMSIQWKKWCRATILELNGDVAKVFYVDFATAEIVQTSALKVLPPEFTLLHFAAFKCHLYGIMPSRGHIWPSITKEFLKDLLDAYKKVYVMKTGNIKDNSMPIEIWVFHTIEGGALEPDISEWRCLNEKLIEQGLAIPIVSEQMGADQNQGKKYQRLGEECISFENVTDLFSEWLELANKSLLPKDTGNSSSDSTDIESDQEQSASNTDWLPVEPFHTTEFTGCPTYVDDAGIIYLHDVAQKEMLDIIGDTLSLYRDADPTLTQKEYWRVGERCVVLCKYDNLFYRGRVIEVNHYTSSCLVHYIDYGNEETCSFANIRESLALHEVPVQTHKCILGRIKPIGAKWEIRAMDYVHKLTVEKECFIKVLGEAFDGITPIDLTLGKLCLNNTLVNYKMAVYVDGSKKKRNRRAKTASNQETVFG